jgi:hypothetical protein
MPEEINISARRGDTWLGWPEVEILLNDAPLDLTGAAFLMQARRSATAPEVAFEFEPVATAPAEGKFTVPASVIDAPAGSFVYDCQVTLASGRVLTPISGTFEILADVSRP